MGDRCGHVGCELSARVRGLCGGHYFQLFQLTPPELREPPGSAHYRAGVIPSWLDIDELAAADLDDQAWLQEDLPCGRVPFDTFSRYRDAAAVCAGCPHRLPCLARWLDVTPVSWESGTYVAATTPADRRKIRGALAGRQAA